MVPNLEVHEHFNNCAIPYIEDMVNVKNKVSSNADSGETISLASRRQERLRSNSDEEASPVHGTIARETYNLDRYDKNAMLLILNNYYGSSDNKAADKVKTTFEKLRFEVEVLDYRNREEILSGLDIFFGRDFAEYASAAVVVVGPMAANGAYKTKRKFFTDDDVLKYFQNGVVPTLEGKPKIFISEKDKLFNNKNFNRFEKPRDKVAKRFQKNTKNLRGRRILPPNFLRDFCMEQFVDSKNFLEIVNIYYSNDRSNTSIPVYSMKSSLSKELSWFWKTS